MSRIKSISALLYTITILLVVILLSVFAVITDFSIHREREAVYVLRAVNTAQAINAAREHLRNAGGFFDAAIEAPERASDTTVHQLQLKHQKSRAAIAALLEELRKNPGFGTSGSYDQVRSLSYHYDSIVPVVLKQIQLPREQRRADLQTYRNAGVNDLLTALNYQSNVLASRVLNADSFVEDMLKVSDIAWRVRMEAGVDRHYIATAMAIDKKPSQQQFQTFAESTGRIEAPWAIVQFSATLPAFPPSLKSAVANAEKVYFQGFRTARSEIVRKLTVHEPVVISGWQWLDISNPALDSLMAVSNLALSLTEEHVSKQVEAARNALYLAITSMLLSIGLAIFATSHVVLRVIRPLNQITDTMNTVAGGHFEGEIPFERRTDEIGKFAQALRMFRDGAIERQRLTTELLQHQSAKETAEASSRVKSQFLANMSHELRTPLNAIIGFSDVMQTKLYGPLNEKYEEYITLIFESGHHLLNLINDILDMAKIEAGKFTLHREVINLGDTAEYCIRLNKRTADDKGVVLRLNLQADLPTLEADARSVKQILLNLLSNAVKFTPSGGEVILSAQCIGGRLHLVVQDTGIGIPKNVLARIGNAFEQADNDPLCARAGTGLGLALVRALVERHNGSLQIESREHFGTTVTVDLPFSHESQIAA